nr:hypothetical protein [Tanacetum cinerariifolium]
AVGTYTASGNFLLAVGMPCAFYSQQLRTPEQIDHYISVDIPDKDPDLNLYQLVAENIMHEPCGIEHQNCPWHGIVSSN